MSNINTNLDPEELSIFFDEMDELQQILEEDVLKLEKDPGNPSLIAEIFRAAHTIKGSSAAMGFSRLSELAHAMESVFEGVRSGKLEVTGGLIDVFFQCTDTLRALRDEIAKTGATQSDIQPNMESLKALLEKKAVAVGSVERTPRKPSAAKDKTAKTAAKSHAEAIPESKPSSELYKKFYIRVDFVKDCQMPFVRALQVLMFLAESGTVIESLPTSEDIENENDEFPLELIFSTFVEEKRVREILDLVSEIVILDLVESERPLRGGKKEPAAAAVEEEDVQEEAEQETLELIGDADEQEEAGESAKPPAPSWREPAEARDVKAGDGSPAAQAALTVTAQDDKKKQADEAAKAVSRSVRVSVERVDAMMELVGELVINRTRLTQLCRNLELYLGSEEIVSYVNETSDNIEFITSQLHENIMKARLLPIENVFKKFPRMVHSLSAKFGKKIDLVMEGEKTELDRSVLEQIGDPLMHIIRNCIDHGIETIEEREKAGKPPTGKIRIAASHVEDHILITIEDDGKGIDSQKVLNKARQMDIVPLELLNRLKEEDILNLVFTQGFSTRESVNEISGRGVGMDVARTNIEKINGSVSLKSAMGLGTKVIIRIPLTLAIIKSLLVTVRQRIFAVPLISVVQTLRIEKDELKSVKGREVILFRGAVLPLLRLENIFEMRNVRSGVRAKKMFVVVISWSGKRAGIVVDSLIGDQDIVIRPVGDYIGDVPGVSGATILGDGNIALIVNVGGIMKRKMVDIDLASREVGAYGGVK